jgi:hypothetical protein
VRIRFFFKRPEHVHAIQTEREYGKMPIYGPRTYSLLRIHPAVHLIFALTIVLLSFSPAAAARELHAYKAHNRIVHSGTGGQLWLAGHQKEAFQPLIGQAQQKQGVQGKQRASVQGRHAVRPMDASGTGALSPVFAGFKSSELISLPVLSNGWYDLMAVTDMNGDGKLDIVTIASTNSTANGQSQELEQFQVFLNDGKGGYTVATTTLGTYQATGIDWCVAVDLGGNGKSSLVCPKWSTTSGTTATTSSYSLALFPSNGDGTFGTPVSLPLAESTRYPNLLVSDFNGDGKQDVVALQDVQATNASGSTQAAQETLLAQTFLSNGQGGFQAAKTTHIQTPMPNATNYTSRFDEFLAGDVNGDGKQDLVLDYVGYTTSTSSGTSTVTESGILTMFGAGDGTFTQGGSTSLPIGSESEYIDAMVLLDYSGSGHLGLVYTNDSRALKAMPGNGDGTFGTATAAVSLPSNLEGWELRTANMRSSGRPDLIVIADNSIGIMVNTGSDSTLGTPVFYPTAETDDVAAADWNGDGKTDILMLNEEDNNVQVLIGQGDGTVRDAKGLYPPTSTGKTSISSMTPIDVNGDGRTDFVFSQVTYTTQPNSTAFSAYLDDGKGGYTLASNILTVPSADSFVDVVGAADFNGDGKQDLLLESYSDSTSSQGGPNPADDQVGIALNSGDGTFTFPQKLVGGTTFDHNPIADVNGDGKPDVVLSTGSGIAIYLGDGTGNLEMPVTRVPLQVTNAWDSVHIAIGDLNGDGKPDMAVSFDQAIEWFPGVGDGTFGQANPVSAMTGSSSPIALGDWNHDGAIDIAAGLYNQTTDSPYIAILTNDGKGNFTEIGKIADMNLNSFLYDGNESQLPHDGDIYVADVNGDGNLDLIATGESNNVFLALGNVDGTFAASQQISAGQNPNHIMFASAQGATNSIVTYDGDEGEYLAVLLNQASLTTNLLASATSVTTGDDVTFTATVAPTVTGSPTPSGTVNFLEGSKVLGSADLIDGTAIYTVNGFTAGNHIYTAQYSGDTSYAATSITGVTVTVTAPASILLTPTVTVTPSAATITDQQSETVTVTVIGATAPTGSVTLASGSEYIATQSLSSGSTSFKIAAGTLSTGSDSLTATYDGDGVYSAANGTTTVTVSAVAIASPVPPAVAAGASTTATATVSAGSTYSGTLNLACSLTSSPTGAQNAPTCSLSPASVTIKSGGNATTVLTVKTTASTTSALAQPWGMKLPWLGGGGTALAVLLMFGIPSRRRRWMSMLVVLAMVALAGVIGCGGGSKSSTTPTAVPGTTSGTYTFTITGTDSTNSKIATSTNVTVSVL